MTKTGVMFAVVLAVLVCAVPAWPQDQPDHQFPDFEALEQDLDWVQWLLENSRVDQSQLDQMRQRIQTIAADARSAAPKAQEMVDSLNKQLEALGAPPVEGSDGQESPEVAAKRKELQDKLAANEGYLRRIELIETRGEELMDRIAQKESQAAAEAILSRGPSVFDTELWRLAINQAASVSGKVRQLGITTFMEPGVGYYTLVALAVLLVTLVLRLALFRLLPGTSGRDDTRYTSAFIVLTANGLMPAGGLVLAFLPLLGSGGIDPPQARLMESILAAATAFLITRAWIHVALFSFGSPRVIKLNRRLAEPLARRLYVLTGVVLLSFFLYQMERADITEAEFYQAGQFLLRVVVAALFFWTLPIVTRAMQHVHKIRRESSARIIRGMYGSLYVVAWVALPAVVAANPVLLAAGYWHLADWSFFGITGSGLLLLTLWLTRNALRELLSRFFPGPGGTETTIGAKGIAGGVTIWLIGIFHLAIWLTAILCLFLIWGVPYSQITSWTNTVLFAEVSLGGVDVSISDILVAIAVFVGLVALTKMAQRQLQNQLLTWAPFDAGVRNALWSATGYIGILAASVASLMVLGVNLSQLVIILGALSVGIGFGLQSIVHDFISGLILLLERPARIGDWIEVDGQEGMVKKIGARMSLVRTDAGGDVWIPNSRLTSSRFTNRSLHGASGYVQLVSLLRSETDENQASKLILNVADGHPDVLSYPEPEVTMDKIDGDAMVLSLNAVIANIAARRKTESDLRFALKAAFREAGIQYAKQDDEYPAAANAPRAPSNSYSLGPA